MAPVSALGTSQGALLVGADSERKGQRGPANQGWDRTRVSLIVEDILEFQNSDLASL